VTTSFTSPMRRTRGRVAGTVAHQTSWPCVVATVRPTPAARSVGAIRPSGAAAPNQTRSQPSARAIRAARRAIAGVGTMSGDGSRTTGNGRVASNAASPRCRAVCTTTEPSGSRRAIASTNDSMPPVRGGKSFVTTRVRLTA
jgi:hypothetical protein